MEGEYKELYDSQMRPFEEARRAAEQLALERNGDGAMAGEPSEQREAR